MAKEIKVFPNIPVLHWIKLRQQFKRSIPGAISSNYLSSVLGMTETSAKANVLPSLRLINLVDEKGNTNQDFAKRFRDDSKYKELCNEILENNYPQEVRDAFPDASIDKEKVKSWFMNHSGVGDSAARRIVSFYLALLEGNTSLEQATNQSKPKAIQSSKKVETKKSSTRKTPVAEDKNPPIKVGIPQANQALPDLNINIQIHISSDATPDQIEKIFEAMSKHLYKK
jgi:hypothetical protein